MERRLGRPRSSLLCKQPRETIECQLTQPLPLANQPLLEQGLVHHEPHQEIAPIKCARALEALWRRVRQKPLEFRDVDDCSVAIERNRVALQGERARRGAQRLTQREERLAQAVAR